MRGRENEIKMFSNPFNCDIGDVPVNMQLEIIDLQNDFVLQGIFDSKNVIAFYKELSVEQYPNLEVRKEIHFIIWFNLPM